MSMQSEALERIYVAATHSAGNKPNLCYYRARSSVVIRIHS